jgi:hypothetical protein
VIVLALTNIATVWAVVVVPPAWPTRATAVPDNEVVDYSL